MTPFNAMAKEQAEFDARIRQIIADRNARLENRARIALMFFQPSQLVWSYRPGQIDPDLTVKI